MRVLKFSSLLLCSLCFIVKGDARGPKPPAPAEGPVWVMEFIEAQPPGLLPTLVYLDDYWMPVREEAKRQGVVLSYQRFSEMRLGGVDVTGATPSYKSDPNAIALLTEYKNLNAYRGSGVVFASILRHLPSTTPGPVSLRPEPYTTVETRVFMEQPANPDKNYIVNRSLSGSFTKK
jgi:hypothetical protein